MSNPISIRPAVHSDLSSLVAITDDCVAGGASIGFMNDVTTERLTQFWSTALADAEEGHRVILVADSMELGSPIGTVQLLLKMPDNQPHRADVAKLQVHRCARKQGVAEQLMSAIELEARTHQRSLLVLDTVSDSAADRLYRRLGWIECGQIPNFALWPNGDYCPTTVFYKQLDGGPIGNGNSVCGNDRP